MPQDSAQSVEIFTHTEGQETTYQPASRLRVASLALSCVVASALPNAGAVQTAMPTNPALASTTVAHVTWLPAAETRIQALMALPADWDPQGAEVPNEIAATAARLVLEAVERAGHDMPDIGPSAEGGLGILFYANGRMADIECFNDGDIVAATYDANNEPLLRMVARNAYEVQRAYQWIRDYLHV